MERKKISVVVSVYNEELSLNQFYKTTVSVLDKCVWDYELIFVNDGSQDGSIEKVLQRKMPKLRWWIFRVILDMRQR